jgi:15-cis-phytoene desaturase
LLEASFPELLALQAMLEVDLQLEITRPAWPVDRAVFGVGALLITFTDQSRTTSKDKFGRLSIILTPPTGSSGDEGYGNLRNIQAGAAHSSTSILPV